MVTKFVLFFFFFVLLFILFCFHDKSTNVFHSILKFVSFYTFPVDFPTIVCRTNSVPTLTNTRRHKPCSRDDLTHMRKSSILSIHLRIYLILSVRRYGQFCISSRSCGQLTTPAIKKVYELLLDARGESTLAATAAAAADSGRYQ